MRYFIKKTITLCSIATGLFLSACSVLSLPERQIVADQIASNGQMVQKVFIADKIWLLSYMKPAALQHEHLRIYIEGDGFAYISSTVSSPDPTPLNPVMLEMAAADTSANVLYMARPCQYTMPQVVCDEQLWTTHRYSKSVVSMYNSLLDNIKKKHGIKSFDLVGYSGGGVIAALLTASRDDITELRTVASNLDVAAFTSYHNVTPMSNSLDPADVAESIKDTPQLHFVGQDDEIVPAVMVRSFLDKQGIDEFLVDNRIKIVNDAHHNAQWYRFWPKLLSYPLSIRSNN